MMRTSKMETEFQSLDEGKKRRYSALKEDL
jgi:hypothetical protein